MSALAIRLGVFTLAMAALGCALLIPATLWGGAAGRGALLAAWVLSVIPGCLILAAHSLVQTPQQGVFLALGSTTVRLLFVAFGALVVINQGFLPEFQFAVWVVACYLGALAIETGLVLRNSQRLDDSAARMALMLLVNPGGR